MNGIWRSSNEGNTYGAEDDTSREASGTAVRI